MSGAIPGQVLTTTKVGAAGVRSAKRRFYFYDLGGCPELFGVPLLGRSLSTDFHLMGGVFHDFGLEKGFDLPLALSRTLRPLNAGEVRKIELEEDCETGEDHELNQKKPPWRPTGRNRVHGLL